MTEYKISVIPGDGIGPELTEATIKILEATQKKFGLNLKMVYAEAGDTCKEKRGVALPEDSLEKIKDSHACLKGPVGETAADVIIKLRLMFDLYANLRPIKTYPAAAAMRPDIDMYFVRENTEDVYKGLEFALGDTTLCLRVITRKACERIAKRAFEVARLRNGKKKVTAIHKANVMRITDGSIRKRMPRSLQTIPRHCIQRVIRGRSLNATNQRTTRIRRTLHMQHVRRHPI